MNKIGKWLHRLFIDGLSGMALGLFATLIVGTILKQFGGLIGGTVGNYMNAIGVVAGCLTGAGIGCGVACKFKEAPLVVVSAAVAGMIGGCATDIINNTLINDAGRIVLKVSEPLGAFVAAYIAIEVGHIVSGKTKVDIIITPVLSICTGAAVGLVVGPPISTFMTYIGEIILWATEQAPFLMGIIVSVVMGVVLTLPISSAALGVMLGLSGLAAGAATVGCCANMVGFAVISYRENKIGGLIAQGVGTSMLQVPNLIKKPILWLPVVLTSAILGPVSTMLFHMTNNKVGSGMGSAGLVGQITTYGDMVAKDGAVVTIVKIIIIQFVLPAILCLMMSEFMRKRGWIKQGDLKLNIN